MQNWGDVLKVLGVVDVYFVEVVLDFIYCAGAGYWKVGYALLGLDVFH
jgi:hypothetical protein